MSRIALVAGEASGDLLGAHLINALKDVAPGCTFAGIGGPKMQAAGLDAWWPAEKLAVNGYVDALRHYREIAGIRRQLGDRLIGRDRPDVFIGIDAPDFNLGLETRLRNQGVATVHYVSPSVWAWRRGRVRKIAKAADHLLALFPFEPAYYRNTPLPVTYVGHPLADVLSPERDQAQARARLDLPVDGMYFALLPGSRQSEIRFMGELFVETARRLVARFPQAVFLVPMASRETRMMFEEMLWRIGAQDLPIRLLFGHAHDALGACDAALVASGTATLEAALLGTPMVIAYRIAPLSARLMKRLHLQPWIGLPNILSNRFVVPEFVQEDATPENLAQALGNVAVDREVKERLGRAFANMHATLRQGAALKAAQAILPFLATAQPVAP